MNRYLQLDGTVITGELFASDAPAVAPVGRTFLDVTDRPDAQAGMTYDADKDEFIAPPAPPDYGQTVSAREFLLRFTASERKAIRTAGKTDEDIADWYAVAQVPEPIRLQHPTTLAGLDFLVSKGLLTAARRDAIVG